MAGKKNKKYSVNAWDHDYVDLIIAAWLQAAILQGLMTGS